MPKYKPIDIKPGDKTSRINAEKRRLWRNYENMTEARRALAEKLVDRAASQLIMVEDLEEYIQENGYTEEYQNGATQTGKKQSSEMQVYIAVSRQYNQTIKQLDDMIKQEPQEVHESSLAGFMQQKPVVMR